MTIIQRSLRFIRKIRYPSPQFAAARFTSPIHSSDSPIRFNPSASRKGHWNLILGLILAGPSLVLIGYNTNNAFAESTSDVEAVASNEEGEAFVTGLRRVEDGSVVSNEHTIKWRIFTDNGRDLFLKGKLDEAEKFFKSALQEAKEGFGPRDPHVASACNNLAELYRVRKAFENAEPLYLEAVNILEEAFGTDDIRVGAALHNLGQFYLVQRKLEQAQKCYEIEGRVLGQGHTDYANTMYHLGMPQVRSLLDSADIKREYLSCLKHLTNLITENVDGNTERSRALEELRGDAHRIEAELSPERRQKH